MLDPEPFTRTYRQLKSERSEWESWWRTLRHYILPRRTQQESSFTKDAPNDGNFNQLYDTTAIEACQRLASGHISYITPGHEVWFKWSAPSYYKGYDELESWYNKASEVALQELINSNFYTEIHEVYLDRSALGTGSLFCEINQHSNKLVFKHIPCGHFVCAENCEGQVDTYYREFTFTPYQAVKQFGKEKLGEKAQKLFESPTTRHSPVLKLLHIVQPREQFNTTKKDGKNRPFLSLYIDLSEQKIIEEDGYYEFPYMVTRFLKWGEGPYGLPPGRLIFPAIKQAQFLNRILDTLGEIAAFPRILELANQVGEIDFRAGGRTLISPEAAQLGYPREWATSGRYDIGLERLRSKQEAIKKAFYLPMFELWSGANHSMTATEVRARENEKVLMFTPSFTLFVNDFTPMMERLFKLLYRAGKLPVPPPIISEILQSEQADQALPSIVYQSKIALILRRLQTESFERTLQRLSQIQSYAPQAYEHFDWDTAIRETARIDGIPEHYLTPLNQVNEKRKTQNTTPQTENSDTSSSLSNSSQDLSTLLSTPLSADSIPELMKYLS